MQQYLVAQETNRELHDRISLADAATDQLRAELEQLQAQQAGNTVTAAQTAVWTKVQSIDTDIVGADVWTEEMRNALHKAIEAFATTGPCGWCGQPGHESSTCWVGAQCFRNCESRKVSAGGQMINVWSRFKTCLSLQKEVEAHRQRTADKEKASRAKRGL